MGKRKFDKNPTILKNKTFYIALVICFVALGLSTYTAMTRAGMDSTSSTLSKPQTTPSPSVESAPIADSSSTSSREEATEETTSELASRDDSILTGAAPFFTLPVAGEVIKNFDNTTLQYSRTYNDWRLHLGVDFSGAKGCPVYACAQGVVKDVYDDPTWGMVVAIDHGDDIVAYYCGLNAKPVVKIGELVDSGKQIGSIDEVPCECVEQTHLHLTMEQNGTPISPLDLING